MGFQCQTCGDWHDELPRDIAYSRPLHYFLVPEAEREKRCFASDDLCVIDGKIHLIRGIIEIPLAEQGDLFCWGAWAQVTKATYDRYVELWGEDGTAEPSRTGWLAIEPPGYEGLVDHPVEIRFADARSRPGFFLSSSDHRMYREQTTGISNERWHEILSSCAVSG